LQFVLCVTNTLQAGLDLASGDSICRIFGGRIVTLGPRGAGDIGVTAVHCFGIPPPNMASAWPFTLGATSGPQNHAKSQLLPSSQSGTRSVYQLTTKSIMFNTTSLSEATENSTVESLATDETFMRQVPITPDVGRVLAALLDGSVATQPQVKQAARDGARWQQLGLTVNALAATSWADTVGTAPVDKETVAINSLRIFDGGLAALSAVNVYGVPVSAVQVARVNHNLANPFYFRRWNVTSFVQ
jgi:hypothetical protein